ncbi:hypothetical protein HJC23_008232 [Cyclotella cryptica]|uniref:Uncharacterized protein n=1 Tax=Cyclotella cryptica TaxID=29204 RepID=A0ABD3Q6H4_9STRA
MSVGGAIVIFAKCPISGVSKTRCAPLLGYDGAASLAQAMLSDILITLSECHELRNTLKVLMYAPGTKAGESHMISILQSLKLLHYSADGYPQSERNDCMTKNDVETHDTGRWHLLPMLSPLETKSMNTHQSLERDLNDLNSSALGYKLIDALERTRILLAHQKGDYQRNEAVLFLGMDAPELPIEEIIYGLQVSSANATSNQNVGFGESKQRENRGRAHMCPAADGGFGLLSVPIHAPSSIFTGVRWSNSLTAVSQLKALTDAGVDISVGKLMFDVDDPSDVHELAARLLRTSQSEASQRNDVLTQFASGIDLTPVQITNIGEKCPLTLRSLMEFGVIDKTQLH